MRFYRLQRQVEGGNCGGFEWFTRRADAEREGRAWEREEDEETFIDAVDITPTKRGILRALNHYADHPDNG